MRRFLTLILVFVCAFGLLINEAQAKRFGGGRSFGMQRSMNSFSRSSYVPPQAAAMSATRSTGNKWLGPLAGLAMGGLLASLFMGHGIGTGILSWLAIAGVVLLLMNVLRSRKQMYATQQPGQYNTYQQHAHDYSQASTSNVYPIGFDTNAFLRDAKSQFIRLQAAYDQKNLQDIRQFTAPVVFAEIQLQLQERGDQENITDVISLDAELLDIVAHGQSQIASVRFTGLLREDNHPVNTVLNEIWHFEKSGASSQWVVSGVQQ
jgi:predicted lipid-binding transport protein (Tim44 family)